MLFVLLNWLYILFTSIGLGVLLQSINRSYEHFFLKTVLYGLFLECIFTHIWASFGAITSCFYLVNIFLSLVGFLWKYNLIKHFFKNGVYCFKKYNTINKLSVGLLFVITLAQSTSSPFVFDNESYYIQTIKWINEYGFVKGLANLHVYLAQMSGWHLLQSAFSFPFLEIQFNDLNGFLYVVIGLFSMDRLDAYSKTINFEDLLIGVLPMLSVFFYLFIDAPSPDLPLFLGCQVIIYFFLNALKNPNTSDILFVFVLSVFLCLIKVIIFPILLLPFILFVLNSIVLKEYIFILMIIIIVSLTLFIVKNYLISGFIFFPLSILENSVVPDWRLNRDVLDFYMYITKFSGYQIEKFEESTMLNLFITWLQLPGVDGVFNKLIIVLLVVTPFLIKKKQYFFIHIYCCIQFLILFFTSPQYRFFIPILLFLGLFVFLKGTLFFKNRFSLLVLSSIFISAYPVFFGVNLQKVISNNLMDKKAPFSSEQILKPKKISKYSGLVFETLEEDNLKYHSPITSQNMFYQTSNGSLPTVHKDFINYLKKYYSHKPQLRVKNSLKDGFYSHHIK